MNEMRKRELESGNAERLRRNKTPLLIMAILLAPFIAVASPICFFTALYFVDPFTPTPEWFSDKMFRFLIIAISCFIIITILKYPLFVLKRNRVNKKSSVTVFYSITILSQIPYLFLLMLYKAYWTEEIVSESFARFIVIVFCVALWVAVFIFYNALTMNVPSDIE